MPFRQIEIPSLGGQLCNVMAQPSSGRPELNEAGLEAYRAVGGNGLHLHGEGGETHSRHLVGDWLRRRSLRSEFFLCSMVCHERWSEANETPIDRFTAPALNEDVGEDLELLQTDYLDCVYFDDRPDSPFEPVLDAVTAEMKAGRVRSYGFRNWSADRIEGAMAYAENQAGPKPAFIVTTELALASTTEPLWPEYLPFDDEMEAVAQEHELAVFAHADDWNLGQCLFGGEEPIARLRPHWVDRWKHTRNPALVRRVKDFAQHRGLTAREVNLSWVLNRPFPVVAIVGLGTMNTAKAAEYLRASHEQFDARILRSLEEAPAG